VRLSRNREGEAHTLSFSIMGHNAIHLPPHHPEVRELPNGLQLLVKTDPEAPIATLQVWVRTGSIHEGEWLGAGLSHLLEHMLFNGTERRNSQEIPEAVQAVGGYINAYTSFDRTVYWIDTPPEGVETCLDVLGDMVFHSTLPEPEFNKELEVIRREMAMGDDSPGSVCSKLMFATAFQAHPCRYPVIGHREVFDQITYDNLVTYYKRRYVPNNVFVVISGPVEADEAVEMVSKPMGTPPRGALQPPFLPPEPMQQGNRITHNEGSTQHSQLRMTWHAPGATHPDTGPLDILSTILGFGRSSRLYQRIRETGLVHSVGAHLYAMTDIGLFAVPAEVDPDKRDEAQAAIFELLEEARTTPVTQAELDKAVKIALSDSLSGLTTTRGIASDIGSSWLLTGHAEFTRTLVDQLQTITPEKIQEVAYKYLDPNQVTIVSLNPEGSLMSVKKTKVNKRGNPTKRIKLSNGATLLVKADDRLPLVTTHAALRAGLLAESGKTSGITRLFSRLLTRDTAKRSSAEVADFIESIGGEFTSFSGYNSFGLNAETMAPDWKKGIEVLAQGLTMPAFEETTLNREKAAQVAAIRSEMDRPVTVAMQLMRGALYPKHPYRLPLSGDAGTVSKITQDDLREYAESNIVGGNVVFSVYGDVDPEEVADYAEQMWGGIPEGSRKFSRPKKVPELEQTIRVESAHEKEQAIVIAAFPTEGIKDPNALVYDLIDEACSDMSSRYYRRIREDLGAAYMVGTSRFLGFSGGAFFFYVATAPEQAGIVEEALMEEVNHLAKMGLSTSELDNAKRAWIGGQKNQLQSLGAQARVHAMDELYNFGWNHSSKTPEQIEAVTSEQIQEVAERTFLDRPHVMVRLQPE